MNLTFPYTQNNNNVWLTNTGMPLREHFQLENSMEQTPIQFSTSVGPKKKEIVVLSVLVCKSKRNLVALLI